MRDIFDFYFQFIPVFFAGLILNKIYLFLFFNTPVLFIFQYLFFQGLPPGPLIYTTKNMILETFQIPNLSERALSCVLTFK